MRAAPIVCAVLLGVLWAATGPAALAGPPWANFYTSDQSAPAHDRGTLRGRIAAVDYEHDTMVLDTRRGRLNVTILPSTSIFRGGQELALSDLTPGMRVEVAVSEVEHRLVAQIIRVM